MKKRHSVLSVILSFMIVFAMFPIAEQSASALSAEYYLMGNYGAVITLADETVSSVSVSDDSLASAQKDGNTVTVKGVEGAVGIVTVTVNGSETFEVPIGYTTFIFDGDSLTVYEGSDNKYEIQGHTTADAEDHAVTGTTNGNSSVTYSNNGDMKLNVNIKKKGGSYVFSGTGNDMSISVNKESEAAANIILSGLTLTSSYTAPITVKKDSTAAASVSIRALDGTVNTLSDSAFNNADT